MKADFPRVECLWVDCVGHNSVELSEIKSCRSLRKKYGVERVARGWLIKEDANGVFVGFDITSDGEVDGQFIPKSMLLKVRKK